MSEETKQKIRDTLKKVTRETENETGTCPEQLIDRLIKLHDELGRTPLYCEIPFSEALCRSFGSVKHAIELCGFKSRKIGQNLDGIKQFRLSNEQLIDLLREFKKVHNRFPSKSDMRRNLLPSRDTYCRRFGSWANTIKEAE